MRRFENGRRCLLAAIAVATVAMACGSKADDSADAGPPPMGFDSARIRLMSRTETTTVRAELAVDSAQRTMGLMERRSLAPDAGMLFLFDSTQAADRGFWMFRTRIPLDIAYIDSAGTIRSILHMEPCRTMLAQGCPTYPAGAPFRAALEMNGGYFARHSVQVGDRVVLADTTERLSHTS